MARASQFDEHRLGVLDNLDQRLRAHSKPPTVRELASHAGVSVSTMHSYLGRLSEEGLVEWRPKHHRSLSLTPAGTRLVSR